VVVLSQCNKIQNNQIKSMFKISVILTVIVFLQGCVSATVAVVKQSQFEERAQLFETTKMGGQRAGIVDTHGEPKAIFLEPRTGRSMLLYCDYGFSDSQLYGFFLSDEYGVYEKFVFRHEALKEMALTLSKGVWFDDKVRAKLNNCHNMVKVNWEYAPHPFAWEEVEYNIDGLQITTFSQVEPKCIQGGNHKVTLAGQISPDSSFAIERILNRLQPCKLESGLFRKIIVSLKSGGGLLKDGYALGRTLRKKRVEAVVENDAVCASSCAVAFLGGVSRVVEDRGQLMFHAPYLRDLGEDSQRYIDCDIGREALTELLNFYETMTDGETGERIFERTMRLCSAYDGWVITGGAAAELFGIATQR